MRKHIACEVNARLVNVAWLSFQPDGSISFGLQDRTYISPKFKAQHFVWSAYNRAKLEYFVPSSPEELEQVTNPHFTFHPPHWFRLRANKEEALFEAIADLDLTLRQDHAMPWIRAFSGPLNSLKSGGTRQDRVVADSLTIRFQRDTHPSGSLLIS